MFKRSVRARVTSAVVLALTMALAAACSASPQQFASYSNPAHPRASDATIGSTATVGSYPNTAQPWDGLSGTYRGW